MQTSDTVVEITDAQLDEVVGGKRLTTKKIRKECTGAKHEAPETQANARLQFDLD